MSVVNVYGNVCVIVFVMLLFLSCYCFCHAYDQIIYYLCSSSCYCTCRCCHILFCCFDCVSEFHWSELEFSQTFASRTCFISFIKLLFSVLTKRKMIFETRTHVHLETANYISLTSFAFFIALWKHTCWPIKTRVLSKLFYN